MTNFCVFKVNLNFALSENPISQQDIYLCKQFGILSNSVQIRKQTSLKFDKITYKQ